MSAGARPLRIAVVIKTNSGGVWILPHLREMRRRGHEVTVVLPPGPGRLPTRLAEAGIPFRESPFDFRFRPGPRAVRGLLGLRRLLRSLDPDVVHYHLYASALASRLATIGMRVGRAHMVAGPLYLDSPVVRAVERRMARMDSVLIAGSGYTADRYRELCGARPPVVTAGYSAPEGYFSVADPAERQRARAGLGIDADAVLFVMVAFVYAPKRMVHDGLGIKGHDVLLDAWARVARERPEARLIMIGGGFDAAAERYRETLIDRFGIGADHRVRWESTVPDVRPYYAAADVSISPSRSENHGAAREASSCGVVSIVSDAGGLPEAIGGTGWVVPAGDAGALASAMIEACVLGRDALAARGKVAREREDDVFDPAMLTARVVDAVEASAERRRR